MRSDGGRLEALDVLRAIAIIGVVMNHAFEAAPYASATKSKAAAGLLAVPLYASGFAVPAFFLVSGAVNTYLARRRPLQGFWAWWKRRAVRLFVPYLFWAVIYWLAIGLPSRSWSVNDLLLDVVLGRRWYFVPAIALTYVLFSLALPWLLRLTQPQVRTLFWASLAYAVILGALKAADLSRPHPLLDWRLAQSTPLLFVPYFLLGCLAVLYQPPAPAGEESADGEAWSIARFRLPPGGLALAWFLALVCLTVMGIVTGIRGAPRDPLVYLVGSVYTLLCFGLFTSIISWWELVRGRAWRVLTTLAPDAYGIYLSHRLVKLCLEKGLPILGARQPLVVEFGLRFATLVVVIGVSWAITRGLAVLPVVRYASGADR
jgi:peptidoglycan/LPS O-acetylase OafA/YrhL